MTYRQLHTLITQKYYWDGSSTKNYNYSGKALINAINQDRGSYNGCSSMFWDEEIRIYSNTGLLIGKAFSSLRKED